jgi:hypothetical protein
MRPCLALAFALAAALSACGPDWREYRSEAGNYAVELPDGPRAERAYRDGGRSVHLVHVEIDKSTAYGVSWFDVAQPEKPPAELLAEVQAKVLRDLKAGLADAGQITLGDRPHGAPGRFFTARTGAGVNVAIRLYAVGTGPVRVYQLIAAAPDLGRADRDIKRFMGSFKLLQ